MPEIHPFEKGVSRDVPQKRTIYPPRTGGDPDLVQVVYVAYGLYQRQPILYIANFALEKGVEAFGGGARLRKVGF